MINLHNILNIVLGVAILITSFFAGYEAGIAEAEQKRPKVIIVKPLTEDKKRYYQKVYRDYMDSIETGVKSRRKIYEAITQKYGKILRDGYEQ